MLTSARTTAKKGTGAVRGWLDPIRGTKKICMGAARGDSEGIRHTYLFWLPSRKPRALTGLARPGAGIRRNTATAAAMVPWDPKQEIILRAAAVA